MCEEIKITLIICCLYPTIAVIFYYISRYILEKIQISHDDYNNEMNAYLMAATWVIFPVIFLALFVDWVIRKYFKKYIIWR